MIRALIVDSDTSAVDLVTGHLNEETDVEVVGQCADGNEALEKIELLRPDVLFIEMELPGLTGLQVICSPGITKRPYAIITARSDRYALQAFEANVTDYLLKPLEQRRFKAAMVKLRGNMDRDSQLGGRIDLDMLMNYLHGGQRKPVPQPAADRVPVKFGRRYRFINMAAMRHIEAQGDYVNIHMTTGEVLHSGDRISEIERKLPSGRFLRVHRSIIINIEHVREVRADKNDFEIVLDNNQSFKSGTTYKTRVKKALIFGRNGQEPTFAPEPMRSDFAHA
ncbi:MAG TPA: LytTR family DNA-binding domain-containing protein [Gammaproteobacteria bacterium]|nr:LytTR family DNA-binding domain-containing protein [Gammaproteobacteria bacterium]